MATGPFFSEGGTFSKVPLEIMNKVCWSDLTLWKKQGCPHNCCLEMAEMLAPEELRDILLLHIKLTAFKMVIGFLGVLSFRSTS